MPPKNNLPLYDSLPNTPALLPRYPIYIPSKGRWKTPLTARFLYYAGVPFKLVVEPQEMEHYAPLFGEDHVLELPFSNRGSVIPARNWIREHSQSLGFERHWQLDDNIRQMMRLYRGKRIPCDANVALRASEDFTDRYTNIGLTGLNYTMFGITIAHAITPFYLNKHIYSCTLFLNSLPYEWRGRYNEDTDITLQVLSGGWCTVLINAFLINKLRTMIVKGGNTADLYKGDGRLKMARSLERLHPGVVTVGRRFNRPQHVIKDAWRKFDTPLQLKPEIRLDQFEPVDEYGLKLIQVKEEIKSAAMRQLLNDANAASS